MSENSRALVPVGQRGIVVSVTRQMTITEKVLARIPASQFLDKKNASCQKNERKSDWLRQAVSFSSKYDWLGQHNHALCWTKAVPKDADAWFYLGLAYRNSRQYDKAIEAYQEAIRVNPEYSVAWLTLGDIYHLNYSQYDKAIDACQEAIYIDPEHADAWHHLGFAYAKSGHHDKAISAIQEAIRINPEKVNAWCGLGSAYTESGQHDKAIRVYKEAICVNPEHADAWRGLGHAYKNSGHHDEAIDAFKKALCIDPEYAAGSNRLARNFFNLGRHEIAIGTLQGVTRSNPEDARAWHNLGSAYNDSGQLDEAIKAYQEASRIDPENAWFWNVLCDTYKKSGQYDEAIKAYNKAIRLRFRGKVGQLNTEVDPEFIQAGLTLAGCHIEAGARSFAAYAKAMVKDLGAEVGPFLRSFYECIRGYPGFDSTGMSSAAEIDNREQEAADGET
jgi:tetratricopeptide (TPR) repeat protein